MSNLKSENRTIIINHVNKYTKHKTEQKQKKTNTNSHRTGCLIKVVKMLIEFNRNNSHLCVNYKRRELNMMQH